MRLKFRFDMIKWCVCCILFKCLCGVKKLRQEVDGPASFTSPEVVGRTYYVIPLQRVCCWDAQYGSGLHGHDRAARGGTLGHRAAHFPGTAWHSLPQHSAQMQTHYVNILCWQYNTASERIYEKVYAVLTTKLCDGFCCFLMVNCNPDDTTYFEVSTVLWRVLKGPQGSDQSRQLLCHLSPGLAALHQHHAVGFGLLVVGLIPSVLLQSQILREELRVAQALQNSVHETRIAVVFQSGHAGYFVTG